MLPDFPRVKAHLRGQLTRWVSSQVPRIAPILAQIRRFHQHEGGGATITRPDASTDDFGYRKGQFQFEVSHEEMRVLDLEGLYQKLGKLAEEMAAAQSILLLQRVSESAEKVGNTINAQGEEFSKEHLLAMLEKVQMEFNEETGKPEGQAFVLHPDMAAKLVPRVQEWEKDPDFVTRHETLMQRKLEEWRDRENRRKLVD